MDIYFLFLDEAPGIWTELEFEMPDELTEDVLETSITGLFSAACGVLGGLGGAIAAWRD